MVEGCFSVNQPFWEYSTSVTLINVFTKSLTALKRSIIKCVDSCKTYQCRTGKPQAKSCWRSVDQMQFAFNYLYQFESGRPSDSITQPLSYLPTIQVDNPRSNAQYGMLHWGMGNAFGKIFKILKCFFTGSQQPYKSLKIYCICEFINLGNFKKQEVIFLIVVGKEQVHSGKFN